MSGIQVSRRGALSQLDAEVTGLQAEPTNPVDLRANTKHLAALSLGAQSGRKVYVWLSGDGVGTGDQAIKGVIYDTSGNLLETGDELIIPDGMPKTRIEIPFSNLPAAGDYLFGVLAGDADRSTRLWGNNLSSVVENRIINPSGETNSTGWIAFGSATGVTIGTVAGGYVGSNALRITGTAIDGGQCGLRNNAFSVQAVLNPGDYHLVRCAINVATAAGMPSLQLRAYWWDADGNLVLANQNIFSGPAVTAPSGFVVLETVVLPPVGAARLTVVCNTTNLSAGSVDIRVDAVQITPVAAGTLPSQVPYVDGSVPGCVWDGTAHASSSRGLQGTINYATDPNFAVGIGGHFSNSGGALRVHDADRLNVTFPGVGDGSVGADRATGYSLAGKSVTYAVTVTAKSGSEGQVIGILLRRRTLAGTNIATTVGPTVALSAIPQRLAITVTAEQNTERIRGILTGVATTIPNCSFYMDDEVVVEGSVDPGPFDASLPGCDHVGTVGNSPVIRWRIPETYDPYSDGAAATTGLTPQGAKLPVDLFQGVGHE